MHVSFTGTRRGLTEEQRTSLKKIFTEAKATVFTHGDCVGADYDAHMVAHEMGLTIRKRPCYLDTQRAFAEEGETVADPEAPLDRNKKIVDEGKILVACPGQDFEERRSGTWYTIRYARKINKPLVIIWPNGQPQFENWKKRMQVDKVPP